MYIIRVLLTYQFFLNTDDYLLIQEEVDAAMFAMVSHITKIKLSNPRKSTFKVGI